MVSRSLTAKTWSESVVFAAGVYLTLPVGRVVGQSGASWSFLLGALREQHADRPHALPTLVAGCGVGPAGPLLLVPGAFAYSVVVWVQLSCGSRSPQRWRVLHLRSTQRAMHIPLMVDDRPFGPVLIKPMAGRPFRYQAAKSRIPWMWGSEASGTVAECAWLSIIVMSRDFQVDGTGHVRGWLSLMCRSPPRTWSAGASALAEWHQGTTVVLLILHCHVAIPAAKPYLRKPVRCPPPVQCQPYSDPHPCVDECTSQDLHMPSPMFMPMPFKGR